MRILVTGASGFIGTALCRELLARGHSVRAVLRGATAALPAEMQQVVISDIAGEFDRRALLEGIEVVVHLAAIAHRDRANEREIRRVNVEGTRRLAEAAAGLARRFVFLSSVKVHGEDSGERAFVETDPLFPRDIYGRSKLEAEQALAKIAAAGSMESVVLRPPLVYGPGVGANFLRLLEWIDTGRTLPLGSVRNRRSLIYLGNLVDAIVRAVEHPQAKGAFLVSDAESISTVELAARIGRALDRPARLVRVPLALLGLGGLLTMRRDELHKLTGNLVVDAARARRLLDWRPPFTLDQGLAETARWFRSTRQ